MLLLALQESPEALSETTSALSAFFHEFRYIGPFTILFLCGIGLPIPEEVTLILSGILLHKGLVEFLPITLVCSAAILLGDSVPYWLGRRFGMRALRIRWISRILHPERFARMQRRFEEHGSWAVFLCRFFIGVRIPGYFVAGTMRMSYVRFLALDSAGVLVSVPISIYLGKLFGGQMDRLKDKLHDFHLILAFLVVSLLLILVVRRRWWPRRRGPEEAAGAGSEGGAAPRPEGGGSEPGPPPPTAG